MAIRRMRRHICMFATLLLYSCGLILYGIFVGLNTTPFKEIVHSKTSFKKTHTPGNGPAQLDTKHKQTSNNAEFNNVLENDWSNTDEIEQNKFADNINSNQELQHTENDSTFLRIKHKHDVKADLSVLKMSKYDYVEISNHTAKTTYTNNSFNSLVITDGKKTNVNGSKSNIRTDLKKLNDQDLTEVLSKKDASFYRINTTMSDLIDLNRTIPDTRPEKCKHIKYPDDLPKISVVVIFREEWPSVLLRTVYSILDNSPPNLLQEIVLVDDGSIDTEPKQQIERHFADVRSVKLLVNPKPLGLMMARQRGIESTTTDYFIVMDSHIEVGEGWLVPLVARLVESPNSLLSAHVGTIHSETFDISTGPFDNNFVIHDPLEMFELWAHYSEAYKHLRNGSVYPIPIASVQGMIIAMQKYFFMRLGGFDPGMKQWGSEQFELSIKVWLCGGRVENIPCSKVAHLFRRTPWGEKNTTSDFMVANSLRVADVWMDDRHKDIIHQTIGQHSTYDIGDLTDRHRIRTENNCKPFQYFVDMVRTFSDVYLIGKLKAKGRLRNKGKDKCLGARKNKDKSHRLDLQSCMKYSRQYFILTEHDQVRGVHGTIIRTKMDSKQKSNVIVEFVTSAEYSYMKTALWEFRNDGSLYNLASNLCLTIGAKNTIVVEKCTGDKKQQWDWK